MNKKDGRPPGERISLDLLKTIKEYPFNNSPFVSLKPEDYSEARLREVVKTISQKIQNFISDHPTKNEEVSDRIRFKIEKDKWDDYIAGKYYKDLLDAKTLKRCFVKEAASSNTINILTAFHRVISYERIKAKHLKRVAGFYYVYMTHHSMPGKFKRSLLELSENGQSYYTTKNGRTLHTIKHLVECEVIGNSQLLLTLKEPDYVFVFYIYIGDEESLPYLQATYLYSNRMSVTLANLAVLEKIYDPAIIKDLTDFEPERGLDAISSDSADNMKWVKNDPSISICQNIQRFLLQRANPIVPIGYKGTRPLDFSKHIAVYPGPYNQKAIHYNKTRWLTGKYYFYFNERFSSYFPNSEETDLQKIENQIFQKNKFFSTVQKALLEIKQDKISGVFTCTMRSRKDRSKSEMLFKGCIQNHKLNDSAYLLLSMYLEPDRDRCLNILLNVLDEDKMAGCHHISYLSSKRLGAGNVYLVKAALIDQKSSSLRNEEWEAKVPETFIPHRWKAKSNLEQSIVNYLSINSLSIVSPPNFYQLRKYESINYAGIYRLHSDSKYNIKNSFLIIYENGYVRFVSQVHIEENIYNEIHSYGQLEKTENTLSILLKNTVGNHTGFLSIDINEKGEPELNKSYDGTFAGVLSGICEKPIAIKVHLNFEKRDTTFSREMFENEKRTESNDDPILKPIY